ncbi:uncharacterized protein LOC18030931 isoform X2 [Eutrema salsugineum]|uniref:uncharacterized protein LOC18030931 isoform X2 n=1 Tax=Eutrema salsugineum TaxID=72664 RepID=UPI000CED0242|nr:uncharacterized protein LOC18030931 isoform X2 [Eutrema salsugineum]
MSSSKKLILLMLSTITLILITESQRTILSEEEKLLNHINKPAIKSFQTEHGFIFDCIDIQKQRAFDHPLLKNHSIQLKPTTIPKWTRDNTTSKRSSSLPFPQDGITCPVGTVIVKRTTLEELKQTQRLKSVGFYRPTSKYKNEITHRYAFGDYQYKNYGAKGNINVWDPPVLHGQFSLASISVARGSWEKLQSISAGWIADGFDKTGCYNTNCPGFVQVSKKFALGGLVKPLSTYDGQQYHIEVSLSQDPITGDWWYLLRDEPIGYWPRSLFNVEGLSNGAGVAFWGGEVFSPAKEKSPSMGSGYYPHEGYKKAAYVNGFKVIDHFTGKVKIPKASTIDVFADSPNCYDVKKNIGKGYWSRAIFFGGPGGCTYS